MYKIKVSHQFFRHHIAFHQKEIQIISFFNSFLKSLVVLF